MVISVKTLTAALIFIYKKWGNTSILAGTTVPGNAWLEAPAKQRIFLLDIHDYVSISMLDFRDVHQKRLLNCAGTNALLMPLFIRIILGNLV